MIKIEVFDGEKSVVIKTEGTLSDFVDWVNEGEIIAIPEYKTNNVYFIPVTRRVIKVFEIDE